MNKPLIDLTESNRDYAVFLPSISGFYVSTLQHPDTRTPPGFELGLQGLDFLKPDNNYFSYRWGLYSAGHAQLNTAKSDVEEKMIQGRDKAKTFILGDSGGFQIITGVLKLDWTKFKTDDTMRHKILDYLEHTADYSMTLDVPSLAASEPFSSRNGIKSFEQCLEYSKFNNDWFVKNRKGNTKFLNSMQGRTVAEARQWFDEVKDYPFEGWGFGGSTSKNLVVNLKLLIWLRDGGYLEEGKYDHMHYLGVSRNEYSSYYTAIKRMVQKTINPSMEITYDAASAFIMATKGQMYGNIDINSKKMIMGGQPVVDDKMLAGSDLRMPGYSPIFDRMTAGDLCVHNHGVPDFAAMQARGIDPNAALHDKEILNDPDLWVQQGSKNKIDKVGKTSWDVSSYMFVMAHNLYVNIKALQMVNQTVDIAATLVGDYDPRDLTTPAARKGKLELSPYAPTEILVTNKIIEKVFTTENPIDYIDSVASYLDARSIVKGYADTHSAVNRLFDFN